MQNNGLATQNKILKLCDIPRLNASLSTRSPRPENKTYPDLYARTRFAEPVENWPMYAPDAEKEKDAWLCRHITPE